MTQVRALALYAGLTLPLAILSHIAAEALALHESMALAAMSPVHAYLGVIAAACLAVIVWALARVRGDLRRLCGLLAHALPFKGEGFRFCVTSAAIQFGFASVTLLGEGSLDPSSILVALIAVALASVAVSALLASIRARMANATASHFVVREVARARALPHPVFAALEPYYAYVPARGNRPPPLR